jgi:hypothetical protein
MNEQISHSRLSDFYYSQVLAEHVTFSSQEWHLKSRGTNKGRKEYHQWLVEACEDADNNDYWRPDGTVCPTLGDHGRTRGHACSKRAWSPCRSGTECQACCPQDTLLEYVYRVALERFQLFYLLGNNLAFRNAGWARSKRCHMLPDPARGCTLGCFRCRLTVKDADCYDIVVPGVQNIICYESGRLTEERPETSVHVPCRLTNRILTGIDRVLPYRCIHGLSLSQFDTSHLEKTHYS